jgi:hypothetical protein
MSLMHLTAAQLERLLDLKKREEKAAPLVRKRDALLKKAAKIEKAIRHLQEDGDAAVPRGRRPGRMAKRGPGRPPKAGRPATRVRKPARKMSAAAQRRVALAVSRAQKRRWAAFRKAQKAKTKAAASRTAKTVRRVPKAVAAKRTSKGVAPEPRPGTLSSQIQKVAGEEAGQV